MRRFLKFSSPIFYGLVGLLLVLLTALPVTSSVGIAVNFLGTIAFPTGFQFQQTEVGGLSGITYNPSQDIYYVLSDDRSQKESARFYTVQIQADSGRLSQEQVRFVKGITLLDEKGQPFPKLSLDPEGIAFTGHSIFIASEGDVAQNISPSIQEFSLDGKAIGTLPVPEKFLPNPEHTSGIRNNLAFESLAIAPDRHTLFTATENALLQDGNEPTQTTGSPCRILRYDLRSGRPSGEFVYLTEPLPGTQKPPGPLNTNGLVDLVALSETHLLSLERAFSIEQGNTIRLFDVSLEKATQIEGIDSLKDHLNPVSPAQKRLLLDLKDLKLPLDNLEGLTIGSLLVDGRRSLILVSDNNFNPLQETQFWDFGINFPKPIDKP